MTTVYIWITIACVLFAAEIMTLGFALLGFALGAAVSAAGAWLGLGIEWQIILFIVCSLAFFFGVRPALVRWWKERDSRLPKTNAEALIGRRGKVVEDINMEEKTGRVQIDGDNFRAITVDGSRIEAGQHVVVVALDSTILITKLAE